MESNEKTQNTLSQPNIQSLNQQGEPLVHQTSEGLDPIEEKRSQILVQLFQIEILRPQPKQVQEKEKDNSWAHFEQYKTFGKALDQKQMSGHQPFEQRRHSQILKTMQSTPIAFHRRLTQHLKGGHIDHTNFSESLDVEIDSLKKNLDEIDIPQQKLLAEISRIDIQQGKPADNIQIQQIKTAENNILIIDHQTPIHSQNSIQNPQILSDFKEPICKDQQPLNQAQNISVLSQKLRQKIETFQNKNDSAEVCEATIKIQKTFVQLPENSNGQAIRKGQKFLQNLQICRGYINLENDDQGMDKLIEQNFKVYSFDIIPQNNLGKQLLLDGQFLVAMIESLSRDKRYEANTKWHMKVMMFLDFHEKGNIVANKDVFLKHFDIAKIKREELIKEEAKAKLQSLCSSKRTSKLEPSEQLVRQPLVDRPFMKHTASSLSKSRSKSVRSFKSTKSRLLAP